MQHEQFCEDKHPRIICLGNPTLDRIWPVSRLPLASGKHRASGYLEVGGGMAATAAVAAARLGAAVSFWAGPEMTLPVSS